MDKVTISSSDHIVTRITPKTTKVISITYKENTRITISEKGSQGRRGVQGEPGENAVASESNIIQLIHENIHADATDDGILVDGAGNIRLSIGTLQTIP